MTKRGALRFEGGSVRIAGWLLLADGCCDLARTLSRGHWHVFMIPPYFLKVIGDEVKLKCG